MSSSQTTGFFGGNDIDPDGYTVCPYNPLHLILNKKIAYHIAKCRKSFLNVQMETCPYNAKHVHPRPEHQYHLTHCRDRAIVDRTIMYGPTDDGDLNVDYKGNCSLPSYDHEFEADENWDEEPVHTFGWYGTTSHLPDQVRLPKEEPIVLGAENQADIELRFDERKKYRQVNASANNFLQSWSDCGVPTGAGDTNGSARNGFHNGISKNAAVRTDVPSKDNPNPTTRQDALPPFVGRGLPLQSPVAAPVVPPGANADVPSVGRGRAAMFLKQERRVTVTPAFALPGIGRGCAIRPGHL